jgi:hypothetical protein
VGNIGRRLRNRCPSWFRYVSRDRYDTPTLDLYARLHPSSDGTKDAPIDDQSNRMFLRIAIGVLVVGGALLVLALLGM